MELVSYYTVYEPRRSTTKLHPFFTLSELMLVDFVYMDPGSLQ